MRSITPRALPPPRGAGARCLRLVGVAWTRAPTSSRRAARRSRRRPRTRWAPRGSCRVSRICRTPPPFATREWATSSLLRCVLLASAVPLSGCNGTSPSGTSDAGVARQRARARRGPPGGCGRGGRRGRRHARPLRARDRRVRSGAADMPLGPGVPRGPAGGRRLGDLLRARPRQRAHRAEATPVARRRRPPTIRACRA